MDTKRSISKSHCSLTVRLAWSPEGSSSSGGDRRVPVAASADIRARGLPVAHSVIGQSSPVLLSPWVAGQIPGTAA